LTYAQRALVNFTRATFAVPWIREVALLVPGYRATGSSDFDTSQLIDVKDAHAFVPAELDDFRGPCPGLNALANHNYIPHNGIVSVLEAILVSFEGGSILMPNLTLSIFEVFGLGPDIGAIAGVLALYGVNLLDILFFEFSIGAPPGGIGDYSDFLF
jgi:hypothetical protein